VYVPRRQRARANLGEEFWRTHEIKPYRVFPEELAEHPRELRVPCPILHHSGAHHCGRARPHGVVAWSLWEGYLKMPSRAALQELLAEHQISLTSVHTSGYASVFDLRRLVEALGPKRVVPIHSDAGGRLCELFPRVGRHADGDWWQVGSR
jgi:ribonuclease J